MYNASNEFIIGVSHKFVLRIFTFCSIFYIYNLHILRIFWLLKLHIRILHWLILHKIYKLIKNYSRIASWYTAVHDTDYHFTYRPKRTNWWFFLLLSIRLSRFLLYFHASSFRFNFISINPYLFMMWVRIYEIHILDSRVHGSIRLSADVCSSQWAETDKTRPVKKFN